MLIRHRKLSFFAFIYFIKYFKRLKKFIPRIDTHTLLAQNYAKPWYTRDMACFGKSLEVSIAYEKRESKPRGWSQVGAQAERGSVYTDLVKLKA